MPKTETRISAGGVAFRGSGGAAEVALISVGPTPRWQLPKGLVDAGESTEAAALREVREEAGIVAEIVRKLDTIEYWYQAKREGQAVRYHKFVHFFLMAYRSGDVADHDDEVHEARWVAVDEAVKMLAFASEQRVVEAARNFISAG